MTGAVSLAAVGDIMLGDSPQVFGYGVGSQVRRHGPLHPLAHVSDQLRAADLTVGNLEVVIAQYDPSQTPFDSQIYRGQPESIAGLVAAGFDVTSVCTNHMMQHGQAALEETLGLLKAAGIAIIGAECPAVGVANDVILERNGLRFGFLAFNFRPQQYFVAPPAWATPDFELIAREVARLRSQVDVMVVALHWGDEFMDHPAPAQVELAHRLVDAGVDVILGHHTHMLQGVERYRGAVIAYSLGNFVYDQWQERLRQSVILRLTIRGPRDIDCHLEPMLINARHQPVPVEAAGLPAAVARLQTLAEKIGRGALPEYEQELAANYGRFRREIYLHYLSRFWRSNPRYFLANVASAIRKRL